MNVTITIGYTDPNHVPPRARKPRPTRLSEELTFSVPEVTGKQAPVGIRVHGTNWDGKSTGIREYRWFHDQLWLPHGTPADRNAPSAAVPAFAAQQAYDAGYGLTGDQAIQKAIDHYSDYLIIDGTPHRPAAEPVYSYITLGLDMMPAPQIGPAYETEAWSVKSYFAARDRDAFISAMRSCAITHARDGEVSQHTLDRLDDADLIEVVIEDAARYQTPSRADFFKARWTSYYEPVVDAVKAALGETASELAVQQTVEAVFDALVLELGEWGAVNALTPRWNDFTQQSVSPADYETRRTLARLGILTSQVRRTTLTIEFVHDDDAHLDLPAIVKALSGTGMGTPYITGNVDHPLPADQADDERARLALASMIEVQNP